MKSDFAILDVKAGRAKLAKRVGVGEKIKLLLTVEVASVWGNDDGTSQEFGLSVLELKEIKE